MTLRVALPSVAPSGRARTSGAPNSAAHVTFTATAARPPVLGSPAPARKDVGPQ